MGIRNESTNSRSMCSPEYSLPLMGIRNPLLPSAPRALPRLLTTPHGDQKPALYSPPTSHRNRTHYPSWGSETGEKTRALRPLPDAHYPSWGSETTASVIASGGMTTFSLPLMGIRNVIFDEAEPARSQVDSLPLMGIRNRSATGRGRRSTQRCSLPLMGIRNIF